MERDRHTAGADRELENWTACRQFGKPRDGWLQHAGREHPHAWRVVALSGLNIPDVVVVHSAHHAAWLREWPVQRFLSVCRTLSQFDVGNSPSMNAGNQPSC